MIKINMPKNAISYHKDSFVKTTSDYLDAVIQSTHIYISKRNKKTRLSKNEKDFLRYIRTHITDIMTAEPERLEELIRLITFEKKKLLIDDKKRKQMFDKILPKIFDYDSFRDGIFWEFNNKTRKRNKINNPSNISWNGSEFIKELNIRCCPYCNRAYIFTVVKTDTNTLVKPSLDHFYSKSNYPYLAVSLYNLIPSCSICNSTLKRDIDFDLNNYIHPYYEGLHDYFKIRLADKVEVLKGNVTSSDIKFVCDAKADNNVNIFALEEFYIEHIDYIREIVTKINDYGDEAYWKSVKKYDITDPLQLILGNFLESKDINNRPLAKLTIDLYEQIREKKIR